MHVYKNKSGCDIHFVQAQGGADVTNLTATENIAPKSSGMLHADVQSNSV